MAEQIKESQATMGHTIALHITYALENYPVSLTPPQSRCFYSILNPLSQTVQPFYKEHNQTPQQDCQITSRKWRPIWLGSVQPANFKGIITITGVGGPF